MRALGAICDAMIPSEGSAWRASLTDRCAAVLLALPDPDDARLARVALSAFSVLGPRGTERALGALARAPAGALRGAFQALKRLVTVTYYADADAAGANPVWQRIGYPGPIARSGAPRTLPSTRVERDTRLDCDVVIVGSGAGGAVVAAELAAAGQDVIVVERGGHYEAADFDQLEVPALRRMYLDGGLAATADLGTVLLAGSCLGGGTTINYTTSLAPPDDVRADWARESGLDLFTSAALTRSIDAVSRRYGLNDRHGSASARDALLERGLRACGWHVAEQPRNVEGCTQDDACGYCGFGCVRDAKRSTLRTFLADAAQHRARFIVECEAERVIIERGAAVGIDARAAGGARLHVRARLVVLAAGALRTPVVLLRSGLAGEIGRALHLHPVTGVWGTFDREVRPWTGALQTRYSEALARLDDGYGVRFETAPIHPAFQALGAAWGGRAAFDATMCELPRTSVIGLLTRDRGTGRVRVKRSGRPVVEYAIARYDQAHVRRAVEAAARVLRAAGARTVRSMQVVPAVLPEHGDIDRWMAAVDAVGYGPNQTDYVTFHQMSTCRMGADARRGAVDGAGRVHGVRGLYVADASLFPTASGVNPMIGVSALAHYVAQEMKAVL